MGATRPLEKRLCRRSSSLSMSDGVRSLVMMMYFFLSKSSLKVLKISILVESLEPKNCTSSMRRKSRFRYLARNLGMVWFWMASMSSLVKVSLETKSTDRLGL